MLTNVQIRRAAPDDAIAIADIHIACWRTAYSDIVPAAVLTTMSLERIAGHHRDAISAETEETAVVETGDQIVGWCTLGDCRDDDKPKARTGEIWGIYLTPAVWRKGIGTVLARWAEAQLLSRGKSEVVLWVFEANAPSRRFYEACGFAADGATKQLTIGGVALTAVRYSKLVA